MTIMAERTDIGPTVEEDRPGGRDSQRAIASALIGLLRMDLPTVTWSVDDHLPLERAHLSGQLARTYWDDGDLVNDQALELEGLQRWAEFWHTPLKIRNLLQTREDHATMEVTFEYRGVQVDVWKNFTDPELIRPFLQGAQP